MHSLVPGGQAERSGLVKKEDVLFTVNGVSVYKQTASECAAALMGPKGSAVRVGFLRDGTKVEVNLVRTPDDVRAPRTPGCMQRDIYVCIVCMFIPAQMCHMCTLMSMNL